MSLFFCDCWVKLPGARVFSVEVEGQPLEGAVDLDLVRQVGFRKPLALPIEIDVNDGVLDVVFKGQPGTKRPPILNAIAVERQEKPVEGDSTEGKTPGDSQQPGGGDK